MNVSPDLASDFSLAAKPHAVRSAGTVLDQGEELLRLLTVEEYQRRHPHAFNASIGGHYRHCLDHFLSVVNARDTGFVDYDGRERNPRIETDPDFALAVTRNLRRALQGFEDDDLQDSIPVRCSVSYEASEEAPLASTLGRELAYAITHAIHHFALVAFLARQSGIPLPDGFGLAPSTAKYLAGRRPNPQ
ncbi:MAG: hypothetical protein JNK85_04835 [Verrucomicrobiales bacterium]|nr:hypothetical protein [Verrucomicrobiales bacterium]